MEPAEEPVPPAAGSRHVARHGSPDVRRDGAGDATGYAAPKTSPEGAGAETHDGAGLAALSFPARLTVAVGAAVVAVAVAAHLAMVFLHVAPENTLTKEHGQAVDSYVYPEFEQNWKLFAPNPLQQNIAVEARALVAKEDGDTRTTGWTNLSAQDGAGIRHSIAPSHTQQNELRRAWEFFRGSHDQKGRPVGLRGELAEQYMKRIVMRRFGAERDGGTVERVQVRSSTSAVAPPPWSDEKQDTKPQFSVQPWWQISSADLPGGRDK